MDRVRIGGAVALVVLVACAGCGTTKIVTRTVTAPATAANPLAPPTELVEFGHIAALKQKGNRYEMRFDPAWFLSGITANIAAAEDGVIPRGQPVPNDNYRVEEGHRLLTYNVRADAHVTVLTRTGAGALGQTPITVAELARIVSGGKHRPLFEPLQTGVWIRYRIDTVNRIDQQYQP